MNNNTPKTPFPLPDWAGHFSNSRMAAIDSLSDRQFAVLSWIAAGKSNPEIAGMLEIHHKTVELEISRIFQILKVKNRTEVAGIFAHWRISKATNPESRAF